QGFPFECRPAGLLNMASHVASTSYGTPVRDPDVDTTASCDEMQQRVLRAAMATSDGWWEWQLASEQGWYSDDFARLLGYEPGQLAPFAQTFANLIHPADIQRVMREIDGHIVGGAPFNVQFRMRHSSGTYRWV